MLFRPNYGGGQQQTPAQGNNALRGQFMETQIFADFMHTVSSTTPTTTTASAAPVRPTRGPWP